MYTAKGMAGGSTRSSIRTCRRRHRASRALGELTRGIDRGCWCDVPADRGARTRRTVGMEALGGGGIQPEGRQARGVHSLAEESGSIGASAARPRGSHRGTWPAAAPAVRRRPVHQRQRFADALQAPTSSTRSSASWPSQRSGGALVLEITDRQCSATRRRPSPSCRRARTRRAHRDRRLRDGIRVPDIPAAIPSTSSRSPRSSSPERMRQPGVGLHCASLALGQRLGLEVVAEGVEDAGQVERLIALGCRLGQATTSRAGPPSMAHSVAGWAATRRRRLGVAPTADNGQGCGDVFPLYAVASALRSG